MKVLLDKAASINATNSDGETALHIAARHGNAQIVGLLLQSGADRSRITSMGATALDEARRRDWQTVVELLEQRLRWLGNRFYRS
ncbi:ankyrin repeat-containing domain protein [Terfezia claveryi]|nr:ankyrin repeat-containing domain protein [Terfezia claveryi]